MTISNIKIVYKVLILLIALGAVSVFAAVFSTQKLIATDATYAGLTDHDYPALVALSRTNRNISQAARSAFAVIAYPDEESIKDAETNYRTALRRVQEELDKAAKATPNEAAFYEDARKKWNAISTEMTKAVELGAVNKNAEALEVLRPTRKPMDELQSEMIAKTDAISEALNTLSDSITEDTHETRTLIFLVVLSGLSIILSAAVWMTITAISRPL